MAASSNCRIATFIVKDELAKNISIKDSNTITPFLTIFWAETPAFTQVFIFAQALTSAPGPLGMYTNINLQKAIRLALELFVKGQKKGKINSTSRDKDFKAQDPNFYYNSSNMECYYFSEQCKAYFDMLGTISPQSVFFASLFLWNKIKFCQQQPIKP